MSVSRTSPLAGTLVVFLALACEPRERASAESAAPALSNTGRPPALESAAASSLAASSTVAASASAPPPVVVAPTKVDIRGTVDAQKVTFSSGYAQLVRGALSVVLTDQPIACFAKPPKDSRVLTLSIPPSSDGRFFAGSTFGVPFDVASPFSFYGAAASMLTVDSADPKPGGRLSFTAVFAGHSSSPQTSVDLAGSASLPICVAPGEAPVAIEKPNGTEIKFVSALAFRDSDGAAGAVDEIWLFTDLPATCASNLKPSRFTFVDLADIGQPELKGMKASGPQPIRPLVHPPVEESITGGSAYPLGYGQIVWDEYDAKSSKLRGRVELWSFTGEAGSSTVFEATRCP